MTIRDVMFAYIVPADCDKGVTGLLHGCYINKKPKETKLNKKTSSSVAGCHVKGPVALRPVVSSGLLLSVKVHDSWYTKHSKI